MNQAISKRYALVAAFSGLIAWACSGDPTQNTGTGTDGQGSASSGGGSGTTDGPSCPLSSQGCEDGGLQDVYVGTGGTSSDGGDAGNGISGSGGTGNVAGSSGGDSGTGGTSSDGGDASEGGVGNTTGSGGTGGEPDAGSDADSGGDAGTGGSSGEGGTGGSDQDGGADADAGSTGSGGAGAGGTSGAGGNGAGGSGGTPPEPFSCSGWTRTALPQIQNEIGEWVGQDHTGDIWGTSMNDVYVVTSTINVDPDRGNIVHFNGSQWSVMPTSVDNYTVDAMYAVWGSSSNDVWAGGQMRPEFGNPKPCLMHRVNQGSWVHDANFPITGGNNRIISIWGANMNNVFVVVNNNMNFTSEESKIYRKNGSSWTEMALPSHPTPLRLNRIWGKSVNEVYAVGAILDSSMTPIEGILWRYNGSMWSKVTTIPSDVVQLIGVGGSDEIVTVGATYDSEQHAHGVRLATDNLQSWDRYDNPAPSADAVVWSPRSGARLVGGSAATGPGFTSIPGDARVSVLSMGVWSEGSLDSVAEVVSGVWADPSSNQIVFATYSFDGLAAVYNGTCQ